MRKLFILLLWTVLLLQGCMYAVRYDGTYKGKVIDEETRAPIEGVVVLGVWNKVSWGAPGSVSHFYDARETVTDKNGEFKIPGHGLRIMTNLAPVNIMIFKAGYTYHGMYPWEAFINWFKTDDGKPLVPLKKLTMEERKIRHISKDGIVPDGEQKQLIMEVNKERIAIGLSPYTEVE